MKRSTLHSAAPLFALAWLGCEAQDTPEGDPEHEHAELGSSVPLEQCRVGSYDEVRALLARGGSALPEWRADGAQVIERSGRVWVGWAEGYGAEDAWAERPIPRTWVACALPAAHNADIPDLSWAMRVDWEAGVMVVQLLDEGMPRDGEAQRPRLDHTVFIDLAARRASPRVLCEVRTGENARTGSSEVGCSAERECSVSASSSGARVTIAPWRGPMDAECADLLAQFSTENVPAGGFRLGD